MGIPFKKTRLENGLIPLSRVMRDGCPTEELKFFDKIHPKFRDLVWKDQTEFRGRDRDYRFNTRLIGFESYQEMVLDAAFRISTKSECGLSQPLLTYSYFFLVFLDLSTFSSRII